MQEITDHLDQTVQATTHQNVSKHLRLLHQAGSVARRREGNRVRYELVDWTGYWLIRQVSESVAARLDELREAFEERGRPSGWGVRHLPNPSPRYTK